MDDVTGWVTGVAIPQISEEVAGWIAGRTVPDPRDGIIPVAPLPTFPCSERFPGFAQSRSPESGSITAHSSDDLTPLGAATGGVIQGGAFTADATDVPSQTSDANVVGVSIPDVLRIESARSLATTSLEGTDVVSDARWTLSGLCLMPSESGCALRIDSVASYARLVRSAKGEIRERASGMIVAGVHGGGVTGDVSDADLGLRRPPVDLGGHLQIQAVPATGDCGDPASDGVADAGGLMIFGEGGGGPSLPPLPVPAVGTAEGGGLLIGGACVAGGIQSITITPEPPVGGVDVLPGRTISIPSAFGPAVDLVTPPGLAPGQVVRKELVRTVLRRAPAWRTAPYWVSVLGAMALLTALGVTFRRTHYVAPVAARIDRFSRQFLRG